MARLVLRLTIASALIAAACGSAPETSDPKDPAVTAALTPLDSCGDVEAAIRDAALREMNRRLDQSVRQYMESDGCNFGYSEDSAGGGGSGGAAPAPTAGADNGASQTSGTNNQVVGVDEADFVKNDNQYIYIVSDGALRILDAWPAPETHEIARVELTGTPKKLFVADDRALVYASISEPSSSGNGYYGDSGYYSQECTYGYDCDFSGDGSRTKISIFDLTDKSSPRLLREVELSGSYISSRRIGSAVHTVVHDARDGFEGVEYWPQSLSFCDGALSKVQGLLAFEVLRQKNARIIQTAPLSDYLPSVKDVRHEPSGPQQTENLLGDCGGFYRSPLGDGSGFITLLSLDLGDPNLLGSNTIVSRPGAVYASENALYVAVRQESGYGYGWYDAMGDAEQASTVHKFALSSSPAGASYAASGVVKGSVLNQFAMDEHEKYLRIATTSGHVPDPNVHSTLSVLEQRGGELVRVGDVDGIAPTEDIRSVRFDGDRAFVVTFKKTDPLFVFDLQNPYAPRVLAELKIPGFSTYMHMMDAGHLLTIGYDADDQGKFAWFTGVMLQIFDVTTPTDPKLVHKEIIGTRGSSSEALTNHLAFNYFAPMNLLSFPITVCEGGGSGGSYGDQMTFSGLMVYDVTAATGFSLRGKVSHPTDPSTGYYDSTGCSNWWTNASSKVKRSIIMDDYVFSISDTLVKVNHLDALEQDLTAIPIAEADGATD